MISQGSLLIQRFRARKTFDFGFLLMFFFSLTSCLFLRLIYSITNLINFCRTAAGAPTHPLSSKTPAYFTAHRDE